MSIDERTGAVVGNPVRREALLRALRSNTNAVALTLWSIVIAAIGVIVLIDRVGLARPFQSGPHFADTVGASLGQWWVTAVVVATMVLAVVLAVLGCAGVAMRGRIATWSATLVGPWRITMGIWLSQSALIALALVMALPVGGVALALGGATPRQLGVGLVGAALAGVTTSALTIAISCRSHRVTASLIVGLVLVAAVFAVPYAVHVARDRPHGDPVMAVVPLVGVADAVAPLPAPGSRFCAVGGGPPGCSWDRTDAAEAPLDGLEATVHPWSGRLPPWAWTTIGAVVVTISALIVTRIRVARPPRR